MSTHREDIEKERDVEEQGGVVLYTVAEAARRFDLHRNTIGKWLREGMAFIPAGNQKLIRKDVIQKRRREWLISRRKKRGP